MMLDTPSYASKVIVDWEMRAVIEAFDIREFFWVELMVVVAVGLAAQR